MKYRNTKTGVEIEVNSEIGGDWEKLPDSRVSFNSEEPEPEPKPEKKVKTKTRKK